MKKQIAMILVLALLALCITGCGAKQPEPSIQWRVDTTGKYLNDDTVQSLVCVQATQGTNARVLLYEKSTENGKTVWTQTLECDGLIGKEGLGKTKEGDNKTPIGDFGILQAFGIKKNPGTSIPYVDVTEDIYGCCHEIAYNQLVSINDYPHDCAEDEHMIDYSPEYNYGLFLDYNSERTVGKGNCIFFHCTGANTYTGGCIAVAEENLVQIMKAVDINSRVIIDYAPSSYYSE